MSVAAWMEKDDCADQNDEAEEDEAEGVGMAGGGLNGQVAGEEAEAVHFPDRDAFIY